jgi:hypothetical protein
LFLELRGDCDQRAVHTGQHYDRRMSGDFYRFAGPA